MKAVHLVIKGNVQGVFFRKYTEEKANELSVNGTVENLPDGTVEIFAEGEDVNLKKFISWCYEGSPSANVEDVIISDTDVADFTSFQQKR